MSAAVRKVLFWLVVLVLPFQGIAVAGMLPQQALAHRTMQEQQRSASPESSAGHGMTMAARVAASDTSDCAGMASGCDLAGGTHSKCGLSAPCALVAAPALQAQAFVLPGSALAPMAAQARQPVAFCTGAPDRPPRSLA